MDTPEKSLNRRLKIYFTISLTITVILLLFVADYTIRYSILAPNVMLERYGIMITIIAIPGALKLFQFFMNKQKKDNVGEYLSKYRFYYIVRLIILELVCFFNILSLYITGSKNFMFMTIITIFALFFCLPQMGNVREENEESENNG